MEKILRKLFMGREWKEEGYTYVFHNIVFDGSTYKFYVEWFPEYWPHSYLKEKIISDIHDIINSGNKYIGGDKLSISIDVMADGFDLLPCYVSPINIEKIQKEINRSGIVDIGSGNRDKNFTANYRAYFGARRYWESPNGITFVFNLDLYDFRLNDKPVNFKKGIDLSEAASNITEILYDGDFASDLSEIVYPIVEPELKLRNYDIYIDSVFDIVKMNNIKVDSKFGGQLSPEDLFGDD
jgi:hypothetical protein